MAVKPEAIFNGALLGTACALNKMTVGCVNRRTIQGTLILVVLQADTRLHQALHGKWLHHSEPQRHFYHHFTRGGRNVRLLPAYRPKVIYTHRFDWEEKSILPVFCSFLKCFFFCEPLAPLLCRVTTHSALSGFIIDFHHFHRLCKANIL